MFDHLVRDGAILLLIGTTVLTKLSPAIRQKSMSEDALKLSLWIGWIFTVVGFLSMICGVIFNSW